MRNRDTSIFVDHDALDRGCFAGVLIAFDDDAAEARIAGRWFPSRREVGQKALDDEFLLHPNDAVVGASHADVSLEGGAFRKNASIGGRNVGMSSEDGGNASVEIPAHGDFFGSSFGVYIDKNDFRSDLLEQLVGYAEGVIVTRKKDAALQIHDCVGNSVARFALIEAVTRSAFRIIRRPDQASRRLAVGRLLHVFHDLALVPDMIAGGDYADPLLEEFFGDLRSDAKSSGGIFAIGNDEINVMLVDNFVQVLLNHGAARPAKDVADKQNAHVRPLQNYDGITRLTSYWS